MITMHASICRDDDVHVIAFVVVNVAVVVVVFDDDDDKVIKCIK